MTRIDEATLAQIEAELGRDGVWVSPELRREVPPEVEEQIEAAVDAASTPTYVTLVQLDTDDPLTDGDPGELANLIRDDTDRSGIYVGMGWTADGEDPEFELELTSFGDESGLFYASSVAAVEHPDDLGEQTLRVLDLLESGDAQRLYEEIDPDDLPGASAASYDDGGLGAGAVTGLVAGALVVLAAVVMVARRRKGRKTVAPTATSASFTLPPAVLSTVRAAEDRRNEARAQADVLALGEAIDAAELDPRRSKGLAAWQAALDHYDVARRILDRQHSPADVVGAVVLAERGRDALRQAVRGRGWTPDPSCYFNPLHDGSTTPVSWQDGDQRVRVPACAACAGDVADGREPADVLDFVAGDRPVHYYKLDLGAWSGTGYGALDSDLLGRLLQDR